MIISSPTSPRKTFPDSPANIAQALKIPEANVHVHQDHVGGGFGSKFGIDRWGAYTAQVSKKAGGKPVRVMLERDAELEVAGCRPSAFAKVKVGAKKDGTLTGVAIRIVGHGRSGRRRRSTHALRRKHS